MSPLSVAAEILNVVSLFEDSSDPALRAQAVRLKGILQNVKDPDTLYFPAEITDEIGIDKNSINHLRRLGCKFHGKKTTINWVREFLSDAATNEAEARKSSIALRAHPQRSA